MRCGGFIERSEVYELSLAVSRLMHHDLTLEERRGDLINRHHHHSLNLEYQAQAVYFSFY